MSVTDDELSELRGALAFLQGQLGGLEKELHIKREEESALKSHNSLLEQELSKVLQRAEKAEDDKADLIKLVDEVCIQFGICMHG